MKNFGPEIKTIAKPKQAIPEKEILWAAQWGYGNLDNGDFNRFPDMLAIKARRSSNRPNPLATFGEAFSQAQDRVWIIDQFFFNPNESKENRQNRIDCILSWMPIATFAANDIRFLTKSHNTVNNKDVDNDLLKQFQEYAEKISRNRSRRVKRCDIQLRFHLTRDFDYVHDRFAIIDDELWHFGATVGGFHSQVSAATRGWRASDHDAENFFRLAWDASLQRRKR